MIRGLFCFWWQGLRFRWTYGDDKVAARRVAGVGHIVQIACAADADIARYHPPGGAVCGQFAGAFANQPDFVVEMMSNGFVGCAGFLPGLVHLDLDVACLEHSGKIAVSGAST